MKKFALIAALLISSITAASAAPYSAWNSAQDHYFDHATDVGENGGGGGGGA